ncbi:STAS/SEC14 domain-containing protein [Sphingomicrobium nitratireducens]|uniref:STAS/SEC14 domain-containing protein n=1 Tax=Sphingomicrobium nitratireducens TaxID=2964666 RepID=UPI0022409F24|nr:STAS/SEC14 domain-containing protein [Sphingomicrobium nitratireducens]
MIHIDLNDPSLAILKPEGALSEEDFATLTSTIDGSINENDVVPSLVIRLDHLPHWDSIAALGRHVHFVSVHSKIVRKVAVVGDNMLLSMAPAIADAFVASKIRRFPADKFEEAKAWAKAEGDDPGRFEPIDGLPRDVVALRGVGIITAEDYEETLVPLVEEKLKEHDKLKMLLVLDEDYATFSGDAAWSDMKFGLSHVTDFTRVALVTDSTWLTRAAKLFAPMMPYAFKAFPVAELDKAKSWVRA